MTDICHSCLTEESGVVLLLLTEQRNETHLCCDFNAFLSFFHMRLKIAPLPGSLNVPPHPNLFTEMLLSLLMPCSLCCQHIYSSLQKEEVSPLRLFSMAPRGCDTMLIRLSLQELLPELWQSTYQATGTANRYLGPKMVPRYSSFPSALPPIFPPLLCLLTNSQHSSLLSSWPCPSGHTGLLAVPPTRTRHQHTGRHLLLPLITRRCPGPFRVCTSAPFRFLLKCVF